MTLIHTLAFYLALYLFGGITFVPLCIYLTSRPQKPEEKPPPDDKEPKENDYAGYFTVTRNWPDQRVIRLFDRRPNDRRYAVLRHGHLMLYDDAEQVEVRHVISLGLNEVAMYVDGHALKEKELFTKRSAVRLASKDGKPWFFWCENCSEKEDFYLTLKQSQGLEIQKFDGRHMLYLVQRLHSSEEQLQTRWLNALFGRLFLAVYKTHRAETFYRNMINQKIARVNKPAFLSNIQLKKINLGEGGPTFTNPRLRDLNVEGECCIEADVSYEGKFRVEVAAIARLELGRFKPREVNLVLAITLKKLSGKALLKIKPPPSNRLWVSFETMPQIEIGAEPVVSSRQITWGVVLRAIESRIREVVAETLVLPNWDDSLFWPSASEPGGIWVDPEKEEESTEYPETPYTPGAATPNPSTPITILKMDAPMDGEAKSVSTPNPDLKKRKPFAADTKDEDSSDGMESSHPMAKTQSSESKDSLTEVRTQSSGESQSQQPLRKGLAQASQQVLHKATNSWNWRFGKQNAASKTSTPREPMGRGQPLPPPGMPLPGPKKGFFRRVSENTKPTEGGKKNPSITKEMVNGKQVGEPEASPILEAEKPVDLEPSITVTADSESGATKSVDLGASVSGDTESRPGTHFIDTESSAASESSSRAGSRSRAESSNEKTRRKRGSLRDETGSEKRQSSQHEADPPTLSENGETLAPSARRRSTLVDRDSARRSSRIENNDLKPETETGDTKSNRHHFDEVEGDGLVVIAAPADSRPETPRSRPDTPQRNLEAAKAAVSSPLRPDTSNLRAASPADHSRASFDDDEMAGVFGADPVRFDSRPQSPEAAALSPETARSASSEFGEFMENDGSGAMAQEGAVASP